MLFQSILKHARVGHGCGPVLVPTLLLPLPLLIVYPLTLPLDFCRLLPQALLFLKSSISGILGRAHFGKKSISFMFGTYEYVFGAYLVRGWYVNGM